MKKRIETRENTPVSFLTQLTKTVKHMEDEISVTCKHLRLQSGARRVLEYLAHHDMVSQLDLVRAIQLKAPTISLLIRKMEREGLVLRRTDDLDMRITRISLTDRGHTRFEELRDCMIKLEEKALGGFSAEEVSTLTAYMDRIYDNLKRPQSPEQ